MTLQELNCALSQPTPPEFLIKFYGEDAPAQQTRFLQLAQSDDLISPDTEISIFSAPGRSEVGGNHTDHNHGKVLAAAVNLDVIGIVAKTSLPEIILQSKGHPRNHVSLQELNCFPEETGQSNALIRGICRGFQDRGCQIGGFHAVTTSSVLNGSGLSSSAAFEILVGTILNSLYHENKLQPLEIAKIGQFAERVYFGKPSGLLDQTTCAAGGFVTVDFRDTENPDLRCVSYEFTNSGYALCVVNTGGSHADLTEDYAAVQKEMKSVAQALGKDVLRETSRTEFLAKLPELRKSCGDRALLRALHFYDENDRVDAQTAALEQNNFPEFLRLINESGRSSYMLNQNVTPGRDSQEQPLALALARSAELLKDRGAWRVHGGGFAGTIQAFVPQDLLVSYTQTMEALFGSGSCLVLQVRHAGGTRLL